MSHFLVTTDLLSANLTPDVMCHIEIQGDDPNNYRLAKQMFEYARDGSDMLTHFDPATHTLDVIAAGVGRGFIPLTCRACDDALLTYHILGNGDAKHDACGHPECHDRYFRDACEDDGVSVVVNIVKARAIHMDCIRVVRNAELVKEDVTFMLAVEAGDTSAQSTVATKKQVLRDIPATFDITTDVDTPELLKAKWPTELPARE